MALARRRDNSFVLVSWRYEQPYGAQSAAPPRWHLLECLPQSRRSCVQRVPGHIDGAERERLAAAATQLAERIAAAASATPGACGASHCRGLPSSDTLLDTKLYMPRHAPGWCRATHLLKQLDAARDRGIMLLAAPAGFGKSTLLSLWLAGQDSTAAWITLETAENDLSGWLRYLTAALQTVDRSVGARLAPVLHSARPPDTFILTTLLNDLAALDRPVTLVLDDYHAITSSAVHDALANCLEHRPPHVYVVIVSREDPPLPLARWRAGGALTELRAADLRFTARKLPRF